MVKDRSLYWIVIVLSIALVLRIALFLGILIRNPDYFPNYYSEFYRGIAENIVEYGSFSDSVIPPIKPCAMRTPLYPLFLSLFIWMGLSASSIVLIQILLSTATCLVVILLTHKLTDNWLPACLAGGFIAADIPSIVFSNNLLTETLFTFLFTLSILYLVLYFKEREKVSPLFASGVLMGFSILCRPIATYFPFLVVILFFLCSKLPKPYLFRRILLYFASCLLILSPWLVRNQIVFGSPFLSVTGYVCLFDRATHFYAQNEGIPLQRSVAHLQEKARSTFPGNAEEEPIRYIKFKARMGASIISEHPFIFFQRHMRGIFHLLFKPARSPIDLQLGFSEKPSTLSSWYEKYKQPLLTRLFQKTSRLTIILVFIQFFILMVLWISFIYGVFTSFIKKERLIFWTIMLAFLYFCLFGGLSIGHARFRIPIVPFMAIGGGVGIAAAYERLRRRPKE